MRRNGSRRAHLTGIPKPLRPLVGGIVLVGSVRLVDLLWRRVTGRPVPISEESDGSSPTADPDEARMVRDRVVYALLLGAAMRVAQRLGLPTEEPGADDRSDTAGR
jgi:hypothetical protein